MFTHGLWKPKESLGCHDAGASCDYEPSNLDGFWEPTHKLCRSNIHFWSLSHLSRSSICPFETDLIHLIWHSLFTFTFLKMTSHPFFKDLLFIIFVMCLCLCVGM